MDKAELRIIAGLLRGRKLTCTVHPKMRPTPQMTREALFSILGNAVPDRVFYDVFAGTGVIGLEAVSRGAASARLVEADPKHAAEIQKHIDQFGVAGQVQVIRTDAYRWAERWHSIDGKAVNFFLSPPFPDLEPSRAAGFLRLVHMLVERAPQDSVIALQVEDGFPVDLLPRPSEWDIRRYARNMLLFLVVEKLAAADTADGRTGNSATQEPG